LANAGVVQGSQQGSQRPRNRVSINPLAAASPAAGAASPAPAPSSRLQEVSFSNPMAAAAAAPEAPLPGRPDDQALVAALARNPGAQQSVAAGVQGLRQAQAQARGQATSLLFPERWDPLAQGFGLRKGGSRHNFRRRSIKVNPRRKTSKRRNGKTRRGKLRKNKTRKHR
jgi:hypothetical protein